MCVCGKYVPFKLKKRFKEESNFALNLHFNILVLMRTYIKEMN